MSSVEPVEQQLVSVNKALEDLKSLSGEITSQRQDLETKIRAEIRLGHQALEAREEVLISQLDQMTREKLKNVAAQQDQLELVATRLKSCCGFLQESLRTGSQVEILAMGKPFVQQVQDVTSSFKPESLEPEEEANLEFLSNQNVLRQMCQQFGQVIANPVYHAKCSAEGDGLKLAVVGETASATVKVVDQKGREYRRAVEVSCELVSSDGSRQVRGEAKKVREGQYEISYLPKHRGPHYLHIRVGDKHISGSPFSLSIITTTPTNTITGVNYPWGLALDNQGQLVVIEYNGHCISIFSGSGKKIRSFGNIGSGPGQLNSPCGVALSATGDIMVADQFNHRIQVFSPDGKSVKCVGTKGNGPLQFKNPVGIAVHPHSKKIYVADSGNRKVQILNEDLTFYKKFGSEGSDNGQFNNPLGINFDSSGNVYVADTLNYRVQVFSADGEYIRQLKKKGSSRLNGITLDSNNLVYVSENANNVSVFTREGHFLRSFRTPGNDQGVYYGCTGITVSGDGAVYVSDHNNSHIYVF